MEIEISIGTQLLVNDVLCEVVESNKCSECEIQKGTSKMTYFHGGSMKCGTRRNANTSWMTCSKEVRSDKKNIIFKKTVIKK